MRSSCKKMKVPNKVSFSYNYGFLVENYNIFISNIIGDDPILVIITLMNLVLQKISCNYRFPKPDFLLLSFEVLYYFT